MNEKIRSLLKELSKIGGDVYILPSTDEFLNEYTPHYNKRLQWLTNFTGSNGFAIISKFHSVLFTDGRYMLQAAKELENSFKVINLSNENIFKYLKDNFKNKKIILDTRLFKKDFVDNLHKFYTESFIKHDRIQIVDKIWIDRPKEKVEKIFLLDKKYSGITADKKIKNLKELFKKYDFLILSSPESVCWLLNIRGFDLPNTPLVFCRAILSKKEIKFFIDKSKISKKNSNFSRIKPKILHLYEFEKYLSDIPKDVKVYADKELSYFHYNILKKKNRAVTLGVDQCKLLKSQKNVVEIKLAKKSHIFDGIALVNFFYWLNKQDFKEKITEYDVACKLEEFRQKNKNFFCPSFPTISAVGPNGAIIHYQPGKKCKTLNSDCLYLCDSGGQYYGATTDVTRTVYLGKGQKPSKEIKYFYTLVLLGHINISMLKFPTATRGVQIDILGRQALWMNGFDYNHGTGHGVGSFLGVHESPFGISKTFNEFALKPGVIISNEPGYYKKGSFGIRIENLLLVKNSNIKDFLEFETLTLCPYERNLIDKKLLNKDQINWLNNYHQNVYKKLSKFVNSKVKTWLKMKTKKI